MPAAQAARNHRARHAQSRGGEGPAMRAGRRPPPIAPRGGEDEPRGRDPRHPVGRIGERRPARDGGRADPVGRTTTMRRARPPPPPIPGSIASVLLRSMEDGSRVLLTHALSRTSAGGVVGGGGCGAPPSHDRGSLILVPTAETTASVLAPDHPYYVHKNGAHGGVDDPPALQLASVMSQRHRQCRGVMAVEAPLMDIIVDGIRTSFMEGCHWQCPSLLSRFLIDRPSISTGFQALDLPPSYRSATLILDPMSVASDIVVNADGNAMKLLCLDVPMEDMVIDATTATPNNYLSRRRPYQGSIECSNLMDFRTREQIWMVCNQHNTARYKKLPVIEYTLKIKLAPH